MNNMMIIVLLLIASCASVKSDGVKIEKLFEIPLKKAPYKLGGIFKDTGEFVFPEEFALDSNAIYLYDGGNNRVCKVDWKGNWLGFIDFTGKNQYWITPTQSIYVSFLEEPVKYYNYLPKINSLLNMVNVPKSDYLTTLNIPYSLSLWSVDQTHILLHILDQGKNIITYDSTGSVIKKTRVKYHSDHKKLVNFRLLAWKLSA